MMYMILVVLLVTLFPQIIAKQQPEPVMFGATQRDEMIRLIRRWYPPNKGEEEDYDIDQMRASQLKLLSMAGTSDRARKEVIDVIIERLREPEVMRYYGYRLVWYFSCDTLGQLKATEAIDLLVECLGFTDGLGGLSLESRPVVMGLVKIGDPAIPKLTSVLDGSSSAIARMRAAEALANIGGEDAKKALRHALQKETDQQIISYMSWVLEKR